MMFRQNDSLPRLLAGRRSLLARCWILALLLVFTAQGAGLPSPAYALDPVPEKVSDIGYFVTDLPPFGQDGEDSAGRLVDVNSSGRVLFSASTPGLEHSQTRLWSTSGPGTTANMHADLQALPLGGDGTGMVFLEAWDVSESIDGVIDTGLWKSNGTAAGTVLVKNIVPGAEDHIGPVASHGTDFYFGAVDANGPSLWKSDGTAAGTLRVKSGVRPFTGDNTPGVFGVSAGDNLFFIDLKTAGAHRDLWKSDGTTTGTNLLKSSFPDPGPDYDLELLGVLGDRAVFSAFDDTGEEGLWLSDGTPAGTQLIKQLVSIGTVPAGVDPADRNLNGELYFAADDGTHGKEIWKTDGTSAGTVMVKDVNPGSAGGGFNWSAPLGGTLLFSANDGAHGFELWSTDGTTAGTNLVKDIYPGTLNGFSSGKLVTIGERAYFVPTTPDTNLELWQTDGTAGGTELVADLCPGTCGGVGGPPLTASGGNLYFTARVQAETPGVDNGGYDVWRIPAPPDVDDDGISDDLESSFGGTSPDDSLVITNSETGDSATASGSSAVGATISSGSFEVYLPPNSSVDTDEGAAAIAIALDLVGTYYTASVEISGADLAGGTKSVTLPFDSAANEPAVCIDDSHTASIDSLFVGGSCSTTLVAIPDDVGDSVTQGAHTVTRLSDSPPLAQVAGLSHTALATFRLGSPVVDGVTAAVEPVAVGSTVDAAAAFADPGDDTASVSFDWGDGTTSAGSFDVSAGIANSSHVYTDAGVYTVTVTVTDETGNTGRGEYRFVVVYDSAGRRVHCRADDDRQGQLRLRG